MKRTLRIIEVSNDNEAIAYAKRHVLEMMLKNPTNNYTCSVILSTGEIYTAYAKLHENKVYTA